MHFRKKMNCVSRAFDLYFLPLIRGYHGDLKTMLDAPAYTEDAKNMCTILRKENTVSKL